SATTGSPALWANSGNDIYNVLSGNVGIGTTSPSQKLEVNGNIKIGGNGNGLIFPDGTVQTTASVGDNWGTQAAVTVSPLVGNGTSSNPIGLGAGTINGQVLTWNGSVWQAMPIIGDNWGSQIAQTSSRLSGDGTLANPLDIAQNNATQGQVLKWD